MRGHRQPVAERRIAIARAAIRRQDEVISLIAAATPSPAFVSLIAGTKPEPHFERMLITEVESFAASDRFLSRAVALAIAAEALAIGSIKKAGLPVIIGGFPEARFGNVIADPEMAIRYWQNTIPLTDEEAQLLRDNITEFQAAAEAMGIEFTATISNDITALFARAVKLGLSLTDFRQQFNDIIPDRARHIIEQIYRTNLTRYYESRRLVAIRAAGIRAPFIQYLTISDDRRTAICTAMSGYIAASGDPIWDLWVPPNHYQCRSTLSPLPYIEAIRRGLAAYTPNRKGLVLLKGPRPFGDPPRYIFDKKSGKTVAVIPQEGFREGQKQAA